MLAAKNAENAENWGFAPGPKSFATFDTKNAKDLGSGAKPQFSVSSVFFVAEDFTNHETPRKEQPANEQ